MALVYGNVGVCMAIGVGIGNVDAAECLASDYTRALGGWPVDRFKQRVVLVGIAVRPTVDCNRLNVVSGIETSRRKYPAKLITNVALEDIERRADQFVSPSPILIFAIEARTAWSSQQVQQAGFIGRTGKPVVAHGDGKIQGDVTEVCARRVDTLIRSFWNDFQLLICTLV